MTRFFGGPGTQVLFHDKAWRRVAMAEWDAVWLRLSRAARHFVSDRLETGQYHDAARRPLNSPKAATAEVYAELERVGFVVPASGGFVVAEQAVGFVNRLRSLRRYALLRPARQSAFDAYVAQTFLTYDLGTALAAVLEKAAGLGRYRARGDFYGQFVRRHFWPEWVADFLKSPLARPLIEAFDERDDPVPLHRLGELLPANDPAAVRGVFDRLVCYLVLFEDVNDDGVVVGGVLPEVRADRVRYRTKTPAVLAPAEAVETAPASGFDVPDLRALLLEIAAARPRLKQGGTPYAKDQERLLAGFDPWPTWVLSKDDADESRLSHALRWALRLGFVQAVKGPDDTSLLGLTADGRRWMSADLGTQYQELFDDLRSERSKMHYFGGGDSAFFGTALFAKRGKPGSWPAGRTKPEEVQALRESAYKVFAQLEVGTFYDLTTFYRWASEASRNPLLLGRPAREVCVCDEYDPVAPIDDLLSEAGVRLLSDLVATRLVGLGCVQMGRDAAGRALLARLPRLEGYFGREVPRDAAADAATRVVVQPDFTVFVIGTDPGPAAQLAPFCDRVQGSAGQGALTYRLSRESIYRAIGGGMKPGEIVERLRKSASNELPANVASEVATWCGQARTVSVGTATVIRCPDGDTAARVCAALGKSAERMGDKMVAYDGKLTPALRLKLQGQGVMVTGDAAAKKKK